MCQTYLFRRDMQTNTVVKVFPQLQVQIYTTVILNSTQPFPSMQSPMSSTSNSFSSERNYTNAEAESPLMTCFDESQEQC